MYYNANEKGKAAAAPIAQGTAMDQSFFYLITEKGVVNSQKSVSGTAELSLPWTKSTEKLFYVESSSTTSSSMSNHLSCMSILVMIVALLIAF